MIRLSRLGGKVFVLNCELIQSIEATPDTVITLRGGEKLMVRERIEEVIERTLDFHKRIAQEPARQDPTALPGSV